MTAAASIGKKQEAESTHLKMQALKRESELEVA